MYRYKYNIVYVFATSDISFFKIEPVGYFSNKLMYI